MKILVAEDEPFTLQFYKLILESEGHKVVPTKDGNECLTAYFEAVNTKNTFDLVIVDYRMPGKNGLEVAKEIARTNPSQRLIMVTAYSGIMDLKEKPNNMKMLAKPFESDLLLNTINSLAQSNPVA